MGCRQAVRHGTLTPASVGSNPANPTKAGRLRKGPAGFFVSQNHTLDVWSGKNYTVAQKKGNKKLLVAG